MTAAQAGISRSNSASQAESCSLKELRVSLTSGIHLEDCQSVADGGLAAAAPAVLHSAEEHDGHKHEHSPACQEAEVAADEGDPPQPLRHLLLALQRLVKVGGQHALYLHQERCTPHGLQARVRDTLGCRWALGWGMRSCLG